MNPLRVACAVGLLVFVSACPQGPAGRANGAWSPPPSSSRAPSGGIVDRDEDGLDDDREQEIAREYFPFFSVAPIDRCATHGVVFRVSPHRDDPARVMAWFVVLFDRDCGANGHEGDDEAFGVSIDPSRPAPDGILAIRAISHQGTACEAVTTCGRCAGLDACAENARRGARYPSVFASVNKHGTYVDRARCNLGVVCDFGGCPAATEADEPPLLNAGEPGHPLVRDLTTEGFIGEATGWRSASLMHHDPWGGGNFGGAGSIAGDLVDDAFVVDVRGCP